MPKCDNTTWIQSEVCWCENSNAKCEIGQVCLEEEGRCKDVIRCQDPREEKKWEQLNLVAMSDVEEFVEEFSYSFYCFDHFFIEKYVSMTENFFQSISE